MSSTRIEPSNLGRWQSLVVVVGALTLVLAGCAGSGGGSGSSSSGGTSAASSSLPVPDSKDGLQLTISGFEVPAHGENEVCQRLYLDNEEPLEIGGYEVNMTPGSHHFVVYAYDGTAPEAY